MLQGQFFQFDPAHRQQFLSSQQYSTAAGGGGGGGGAAGDKSPGYQLSPISPAINPGSPQHPPKPPRWKGETNPLKYVPFLFEILCSSHGMADSEYIWFPV